ncbi:unnamed protein product, partial [Heterotrigona itama]
MGRCQSTPGLVESRGRIPLEEMWVSPVDTKSTHAYSAGHSLFSPSPSPVTSRGLPSTGNNVNANNVARSMDSPMSATSSGHSSEDQTARAPQSAAAQPSAGRQSTHSGKYFILKRHRLEIYVLLLNPSTPILFLNSLSLSLSLFRTVRLNAFFLRDLMDVKSPRNPPLPLELKLSMLDARYSLIYWFSMTQLVEGATPLLGTNEALLAEIKRLRERLICLESENAAMSAKLNQKQWEVENRLAEIEMQICGASSSSSLEDNNERNRETDDKEEPEGARISGRSSDTKSIGSLSQHFFESDEDERYYGTCNGYASQPGSKSNLLLCSECDQKTRTCTYRPQTPGSYSSRYVEERFDDRLQEPGTSRTYKSPVHISSPRSLYHDQEYSGQSSSPRSFYRDQDYQRSWSKKYEQEHDGRDYEDRDLKQDDDSPVCEICHGNGQIVQCEHCDFSSEGDLICFRCQSDEGSSNGQNCPRCEKDERILSSRVGSQRGTTSSGDEGKYPVDAVVKIQVNDHMIDVDSDETPDSDLSSSHHHQRSTMERLDTIVEAKGDTASENDEENGGTKLNGTNSARYLNYMIVLF